MRGPHFTRLKITAGTATIASVFAGALAVLTLVLSSAGWADDFHRLRGDAEIDALAPAPPLATPRKIEKREARNYPEQPPIIPHSIAGYEISLRANKCLSCHSRRRSVDTGAPMVSVTHYTNREQQVLSAISPRRYFCMQCHVAQTAVAPPVQNTFVDALDLPLE